MMLQPHLSSASLTLAPALSQRGRGGLATVLFALIFISGAQADDLAEQIRKLDPIVLTPPKDDPDHYRNLLPKKIDAELREAGARSTREWKAIQNLEQWQSFRKEKLALMKKALGHWPDPPKDLKAQTTKTLDGEGFKIECLVCLGYVRE